jgi:hypothetical protein
MQWTFEIVSCLSRMVLGLRRPSNVNGLWQTRSAGGSDASSEPINSRGASRSSPLRSRKSGSSGRETLRASTKRARKAVSPIRNTARDDIQPVGAGQREFSSVRP